MNTAIIVAGGSGLRVGGDVPKQFLNVGGKPIIIWCLERFESHADIDEIIAVCKTEYMEELRLQADVFGISKLKRIVLAGDTRRSSVANGLRFINHKDVVLIHDAVRPLVSARIISDNIEGARAYGAVSTAIPAKDTILTSPDGRMISAVPLRSELYHAQTPQSFKYGIIVEAHQRTLKDIDATDDCQLALRAGYKVAIVPGDELNFKVTTPNDLVRLEALL